MASAGERRLDRIGNERGDLMSAKLKGIVDWESSYRSNDATDFAVTLNQNGKRNAEHPRALRSAEAENESCYLNSMEFRPPSRMPTF
jgi:hypothetical protein